MKHAVIHEISSKVVNIIELENSLWNPPQGCYVIQSEEAEIGDVYDKDKDIFFTKQKTQRNINNPKYIYKPDFSEKILQESK